MVKGQEVTDGKGQGWKYRSLDEKGKKFKGYKIIICNAQLEQVKDWLCLFLLCSETISIETM